MAIIDQPKPTEPKSPQPERAPLQPGQPPNSGIHDESPTRSNFDEADQRPDRFEENVER